MTPTENTIDRLIAVLSSSPALALLGLALLVALVFAPAALRLAGLSGLQIVELLRSTMTFVVELVRQFRAQNKEPP